MYKRIVNAIFKQSPVVHKGEGRKASDPQQGIVRLRSMKSSLQVHRVFRGNMAARREMKVDIHEFTRILNSLSDPLIILEAQSSALSDNYQRL